MCMLRLCLLVMHCLSRSNISGLGQDLDVQITIHAPCGRFKEARSQCLACLDEVLRQSTAAAASSTVDAHATSGWIQVSSMPQCLKLKHPVLDVRMDVQVSLLISWIQYCL